MSKLPVMCDVCEKHIHIGGGDGLCDYYDNIKKKFIINPFEPPPENCPRLKKKMAKAAI